MIEKQTDIFVTRYRFISLILHQKAFTYHRKQKETSLSCCFSFQRLSEFFEGDRVLGPSPPLLTSKFTISWLVTCRTGLIQHHGTTELIPCCEGAAVAHTTPKQSPRFIPEFKKKKINCSKPTAQLIVPEEHSSSLGLIKTHHFHFTHSKACATLRFP